MAEKREKISGKIRLTKTRKLLQNDRVVSISDLARQFAVSEMTIRRDLDKLEHSGQVQRTHGGAIPTERMDFTFDFLARRKSNMVAKKAIAREAVKMIKLGDRVILDTGTTTLELANLLREMKDITVITPSLAVASELHFCPYIQTILLGGLLRRGRADLTGIVAETVLDMFTVHIAFEGSDGVGLDGTLYNCDMEDVKIHQKIRQRAERVYILADSSKIGKTQLVRTGSLQTVDGLITDNRITTSSRLALEKHGANVIIVTLP
jgi:DeoR/GlpR family transcriptional regulator of sugar metabolism